MVRSSLTTTPTPTPTPAPGNKVPQDNAAWSDSWFIKIMNDTPAVVRHAIARHDFLESWRSARQFVVPPGASPRAAPDPEDSTATGAAQAWRPAVGPAPRASHGRFSLDCGSICERRYRHRLRSPNPQARLCASPLNLSREFFTPLRVLVSCLPVRDRSDGTPLARFCFRSPDAQRVNEHPP